MYFVHCWKNWYVGCLRFRFTIFFCFPPNSGGGTSHQQKSSRLRPRLTKLSAHMLSYLYKWVTKKFIFLAITMQFCQMLLNCQGTIQDELKASWTSLESVSSQRLDQPLAWAISIAWITATSSTKRENVIPKLYANPPIKSPKSSLYYPPQAAKPGNPFTALSMLHLIHKEIRGCQRTFVIVGAFGGWVLTQKALNFANSSLEA